MATPRGARMFFRLGRSSARLIGINHERRLITAAVPSLLQTSSKRRFKDVSALPVNKYDLKGVGIMATSPALFSTEAFEALADEASNDEVEEDSQSGMERKWPSPITQVIRHTAFVGGYDLNLNELSSTLSSQFGNVKSIFIPKQRIASENQIDTKKYQYVFVDFVNRNDLLNAVKAGQIIHEGKVIDIKERSQTSQRKQELDRTFTVTGLPSDTTIDQIHDYFKSLSADIQVLNLVIKPNQQNRVNPDDAYTTGSNIAFVVFDKDADINSMSTMEHVLDGQVIKVYKSSASTKQQRRDRANKVLVEGLYNVSDDVVKEFFDSISPTKSVFYMKNYETGQYNGIVLIEFENQEGAILAAEQRFQNINGCSVEIRRIGICNE